MRESDQKKCLLSAHGLSIGYESKGKRRAIIAKDLNIDLSTGRFICLLGPNGVGKSTLIRTLAGMQKPLDGRILLSNKDLATITPREKARQIGIVLTENITAGMMDAYSLVALGRHPYSGWFGALGPSDKERIKWALKTVDATDLEHRQVAELSDGERQKILIARALAQEAKVLILDEPTAYLDITRRVELMESLRNLTRAENIGALLSTHDLDLALRFADELWILTSDGKIITGPPEVLALDGELEKVFTNENLKWDTFTGTFQSSSKSSLNAILSGNGIATQWTQKTLIRLGYRVFEEASAPPNCVLQLKVTHSSDRTAWTLQTDSQQTEFHSLSEVIDYLQKQ